MPPEHGNKKSLSVWIKEDIEEKLDELSKKTGIPKPKLTIDIINEGLKGLEGAAKIGFLQLAIVLRDLRDWVKKAEKEEKLEGKPMTIWVEKDLIERLKVMGDKGGLSKSKLASNFILVGVEDKQFKKSLMNIAYPKAVQKWGEKIKKRFNNGISKEGLPIKLKS
ncbi:ribbon-helix-helix domain-containing protein [Thermodesulfobacteriota bacterium]